MVTLPGCSVQRYEIVYIYEEFLLCFCNFPVWGVNFGYIKWMKPHGVIDDAVCLTRM